MNKFLDETAIVIGTVVGLSLLGVGLAIGAIDRAYDWVALKFAIPPRGSRP